MSINILQLESQNDELISTAVASSSVLPPTPQWIELPTDVTANILQRLGALEMLDSAEYVCTTWRRICADPAMWRVFHIDYSLPHYGYTRLKILWRRAVDRSQGQLLDPHIQSYCDDNLLNYIADRPVGLKRLYLHGSGSTRKCLNEAFKKLAHLEELHLVVMPSLLAEDIINIGISCPNLKSFTFNEKGFLSPYYTYKFVGPINNKYALEIAGNMPNLCHLCLIANPIGNEGLGAILDGCPNLESLDVRQCFGLYNLHGALSKRCSEHIKLLKLPLDTVSSREYREFGYASCDSE